MADETKDDSMGGFQLLMKNPVAAIIAQLGAFGLICVMFYNSQNTIIAQSKDDRILFREELNLQRKHDENKQQALAALLMQNQRTSEATLKAVEQNAILLAQVLAEVKRKS